MSERNPYNQKNDGGWCGCGAYVDEDTRKVVVDQGLGGCGRVFGGLTGFDKHRVTTTGEEGYDPEYDWRCATEAELLARGLHASSKGWWVLEAPFQSKATA